MIRRTSTRAHLEYHHCIPPGQFNPARADLIRTAVVLRFYLLAFDTYIPPERQSTTRPGTPFQTCTERQDRAGVRFSRPLRVLPPHLCSAPRCSAACSFSFFNSFFSLSFLLSSRFLALISSASVSFFSVASSVWSRLLKPYNARTEL